MNLNTSFVAAPMVNQSDLPFRLLTRKHGATMAYTQMLLPEKLLNEQEYLEYHIRDLTIASADPLNGPVVVQLCGNDPEIIVQAGKKLQNYCTAIGAACPSSPMELPLITCRIADLNLGCPQEAARDGHYGAYLLPQKDWPLVEDLGTRALSS
jgi:tRNA-dihydrouridine synthase 1